MPPYQDFSTKAARRFPVLKSLSGNHICLLAFTDLVLPFPTHLLLAFHAWHHHLLFFLVFFSLLSVILIFFILCLFAAVAILFLTAFLPEG